MSLLLDTTVEGFANAVSGKRIGRIDRRGKYLIVPLAKSGSVTSSHLILHMGMTGSIHIREPGETPVRYRRAILYLDDGRRIELNDPRRWARLWCAEQPEHAFPNLGPEPWDLTPSEFARRVKSKRSRIKPALLDQNLVAGVGNIYADESLHRSRISPLRRCNRISVERLEILHSAIIAVLDPCNRVHLNSSERRRKPIRRRRLRRANARDTRTGIRLPILRPIDRLEKHQRSHRLLLH